MLPVTLVPIIYELQQGLEIKPWREMHPARSDCYMFLYAECMLHSGEVLDQKFKGKNSEGRIEGLLYKEICL